LASGISSYLTGEFVPSSTFSSFVSNWSEHLTTLYSNDSYLSSCVSNLSANKLDASSYHELTAGANIDIQNYVISGKDWTNEIKEASANAFNEATAANPTSSTQWNSCYETVNTNSGEWNKVSGKLDTTAFESYTANDETYLLKGGYNIGVSSDDVNKETTIYYTGTNGDEQVNQVVRQYSANGTWLTAHQDLSDYATKQWVEDKGYITGVDLTPYQEKSAMTAYQPVSSMTSYYTTGDAYTLSSFFSGEIGNKLDYSAFTEYTANNKTYTLIGGKDIGISSDDVNKETTIYFTGSNGDEEVNSVVRTNSADWSNGGYSYTALTSYSSTWNDITVYQSHSADYITAHQVIPSSKWEDASDIVQTNSAQWAENTGDTAVNDFVYNNSASITSINNSGALWNAVYDLVATYSAKWLINGDV